MINIIKCFNNSFFVGGNNFLLETYTLPTLKKIKNYKINIENIKALAISPNKKYFLVAGENSPIDTKILYININSGEILKTFKQEYTMITAIEFLPDGKHFIFSSWNDDIKMWDINNNYPVYTFKDEQVSKIKISSDGKYFFSCGGSNLIKKWNIITKKLELIFKGHKDIINDIDISRDGKFLASVSEDKTLKLWEIRTGKEINNIK